MKKSEMAKNIWFNRTNQQSVKAEIHRYLNLTKVEQVKKIVIYYFYLVLFKLALLEFYLNLYVGKLFISCFNVVNLHKIRVNALVNSRAELIRDSQK